MRRLAPIFLCFVLMLAVVCSGYCMTKLAIDTEPHSCCHHSAPSGHTATAQAIPITGLAVPVVCAVASCGATEIVRVSVMLPPAPRPMPPPPLKFIRTLRI